MKLVRGMLMAERMAQVAGAQALVEGEISPPAMKQDIEKYTFTTSKCFGHFK